MIKAVILMTISFFIEGLMSNLLSFSLVDPGILKASYLIITITILLPYFNNEKKYFILITIFGFLFDITYTNSLPINTIIFILIGLLNKTINYYLPNNIFTTIIKSIFITWIYYLLVYLSLLITNYSIYPLELYWILMYKTIIMTVIYTIILYYITKRIFQNNLIR